MPDFAPIEDYYMIGDGCSMALVSRNGSIDWLCLPYFDSSSVFGRLLDTKAGSFSLDSNGYDMTCDYVTDTAIVEHKLIGDGSQIVVRDFMVPNEAGDTERSRYLVRKLSGNGQLTLNFNPQPDYARHQPQIDRTKSWLEMPYGQQAKLFVHMPDGVKVERSDAGYNFTVSLQADEPQAFILEYAPSGRSDLSRCRDPEADTRKFWQEWVSKGSFVDFCRSSLIRSAITLKLLQFSPTGALVAAPTTSLPEDIGGLRNWDYRYVWIRDATFTLFAFYVLGYLEEAQRFFDFIFDILERQKDSTFDVSLMYTVFGDQVPDEQVLGHLSGYKDSEPVRIGNEAGKQLQLDVYGALIDAYYFACSKGLSDGNKDRPRTIIMQLLNKIEQDWQKPDSGIWEARDQPKHYTYSKVMCWVGADRVTKLQKELGLSDSDAAQAEQLRNKIDDYIWLYCYDEANQVLRQYPGAKTLDATNLLFVPLQFLDKHKDQTRRIIDNTCQQLAQDDGYVFRYQGDDGLPGQEGAFVLCSYWLISALAILEDTDAAEPLFKQMEGHLAKHGLIAEEIDPQSGEYLGNYPQAFSHLGFIMSAHYLHKYLTRKQMQ